jgi:hypothetical protein
MIAPHKGREIIGVLDGTKPLGSISTVSRDAKEVLSNTKLHKFIKDGELYFALTEAPINAYKFLSSSASAQVVRSKKEHQRLLGRLFGYTEEQIDGFIRQNFTCDCVNCKGRF